jgi:hypothetical protein
MRFGDEADGRQRCSAVVVGRKTEMLFAPAKVTERSSLS